jgi:CRISPR/Cas system CMR-associated protein Cmr5 small subunit
MSNENKNEYDFSGHIKNIEDAQNAQTPIDGKTLTDEELETAGLVRTSAFVRSKRSKNALRLEKYKKKQEESGIKQLNVEVPEQYRDIMKQLANALKEGQDIVTACKTLLPQTKTPDSIKVPKKAAESVLADEHQKYVSIGKKVVSIQKSGGIRAALLKIIL